MNVKKQTKRIAIAILAILLFWLVSKDAFVDLFDGIATFRTTTYFYFGLVLLVVLSFYLFRFNKNILLLLVSGLIGVFFIEYVLCFITKTALTYSEKNGGTYYSQTMSIENNMDQLLAEPHRTDVHTVEFAPFEIRNPGDAEHLYRPKERYNALGFRGILPPFEDDVVIAFGDSYTESVCVELPYSYPVLLEEKIQDSIGPLKVLNAGVSGNDPFFDWIMLRKLSLKYDNIKTIIFLMNTTDINEISMRGGFSRFLPDGRLKYNSGPFWEPLYAISHVFRVLAHKIGRVNYSLLTDKQQEIATANAIFEIETLISDSIMPYCLENEIQLIVGFHPGEWECQQESPDYKMMDQMLESIEGLAYRNIHGAIKTEYDTNPDVFYHLDGHFSEVGYEIIADEIFTCIAENPIYK